MRIQWAISTVIAVSFIHINFEECGRLLSIKNIFGCDLVPNHWLQKRNLYFYIYYHHCVFSLLGQ